MITTEMKVCVFKITISYFILIYNKIDYYSLKRVVLAIVLYFVGLLFTFLGYRLFNFTIILLGFLSCGLFSYIFLSEVTDVCNRTFQNKKLFITIIFLG